MRHCFRQTSVGFWLYVKRVTATPMAYKPWCWFTAVYAASHIQNYAPCHVLALGLLAAGLDTALQFASAEPQIVISSRVSRR